MRSDSTPWMQGVLSASGRRAEARLKLCRAISAISTISTVAFPVLEQLEERLVLSATLPHKSVSPTAHKIHAALMQPAALKKTRKAHRPTPADPVAKPTFITVDSRRTAKPLAYTAPVGLTPTQIRQAYGINQITFGSVQGTGAGETIAIIDAYNDPDIVKDLATFDTALGLPDTTTTQVNTILTRVNETGGSSLPGVDNVDPKGDDWEVEESLDVEWAHAIAPDAKLVLVECNSASYSDLIQNGANTAAGLSGVVAVTMSFGGGEFPSETALDSYFTHTGVTFLASTGDSAQPAEYPAVSPDVVAVGGTTLNVDSSGDYEGESAWDDGGGGVSTFEPQPVYQDNVVTQNQAFRSAPDVAFDADPNTGVAVCDSYDFGSAGPWVQVGGTSLSSPSWAGLIAIADQGRSLAGLSSLSSADTLTRLYNLPSTDFNDITTGNNGFTAGPGYDLTTGRGSPIANLLVGALAHNPAGPYVVSSTPQSMQAGPVSSVDFNFNQAMNPASFSIASSIDSFTGPGNANLLSQITGYSWSNSNQTLQINFNAVTGNGTYSMVIGPQIDSASGGNEMDQNFDGVAGEASDTYTQTFTVLTSAGPDSYGYSATPYPYESLSLTPGAAGVSSILSDTDDGSASINLGSNTFDFYGTSYTGTNLYVDSNGFITFDSGSATNTEYANDDLTSDPTQATIAPLWDDWTSTAGGGQVLYEFRDDNSSGNPQELVIEWDQFENQGAIADGSSDAATFEAILQLNTGSAPSTIIFNYPNLNLGDPNFNNGASATVGIKNAGTQGGQSLLVSLDNPSNPLVATGEAIRIATTPPPSVAGADVFYGGSYFDGSEPAPNANDDNAIATDKTPLLPGQTATFANYTSYTDGINGIMVDLADAPPATLSLSDFSFAVGNNNTPSTWATAPAPTTLLVIPGGGVNDSTRIEFVWANNAIQDQWLQVTVNADSDTGLANPYIFYFGNAIGSSGDNPDSAQVNATDEILARNNQTSFLDPATITNPYDYNRDGSVNATDEIIARNNQTSFLNALQLISVPAASQATLDITQPSDSQAVTSVMADISAAGSVSTKSLQKTKREVILLSDDDLAFEAASSPWLAVNTATAGDFQNKTDRWLED